MRWLLDQLLWGAIERARLTRLLVVLLGVPFLVVVCIVLAGVGHAIETPAWDGPPAAQAWDAFISISPLSRALLIASIAMVLFEIWGFLEIHLWSRSRSIESARVDRRLLLRIGGLIPALCAAWLAGMLALGPSDLRGLVILFLTWPLAYGALAWRDALKRWKWIPGRCPKCGYDLSGLPTGGCPECGWGRRRSEREQPAK